MSIRVALKLFVVSAVVFAVAFALRRAFLWDVAPISWEQPPQSLWSLGIAFLLHTIENLAGALAVISLAVAAALALDRRRPAHPPKLRNSE